MTIQKVCIVGPGGIGGTIAARLAETGLTVSALARPARAAVLNTGGIRLNSLGREIHARIHAASDPAELGPQDLVIVATKNNQLAEIASQLPPLCGPDTAVIFAMNGAPWWFFDGFGGPLAGTRLRSLDPDGTLAAAIPLARVIWGVVYFSATGNPDGTILHNNANGLTFGRPSDDTDGLEPIAAVFTHAGFDAKITDNIRKEIWTKLAVNVAVNPPGALTLATITQMWHEPLLREAMNTVLGEMRSVGQALGIDPGPLSVDKWQNAPVRVSLLQDLEAGRPLEVSSVIEAAVEIADCAGVPVPHTRAFLGLMRLRGRIAGLLPE
jgi:2-dehydropantoate 2-reductase